MGKLYWFIKKKLTFKTKLANTQNVENLLTWQHEKD